MTERPFPPTPAPGLTTSVQFGCDGRWWSEAQMHDYVRADRLAAAPAAQPDWEQAILREWALAYPRMDIHAKPGTLVMFDGRGGYEMEQEHARKTLTMRGLYEVERTTVHSSSSTVHLRGVDGEWNTVMFSKPPVSEPAAQPEGAKADTERLDYLQRRGSTVDLPMRAGRLVFRVGGWSIAVDADLRTAIDKARFAAAPQEPQ